MAKLWIPKTIREDQKVKEAFENKRPCAKCGREFKPKHHRNIYCAKCRKPHNTENSQSKPTKYTHVLDMENWKWSEK